MQLIAHRGASGHAPENTLAAFRLALEMGAKAIELDVHKTKDGELAVIHDFDLKRVARRRGRLRDLTLREAAAVDIGSWFDRRFASERVPRLEEVLDLVEGKAQLHIELKKGSSLYPGIEERTVDLLRRRDAWTWTVISSFDHKALFKVRSLDERARLGYLRGALTTLRRSLSDLAKLKGESLHMSRRQASPKAVRAAHERGLKVLIYTVNTSKDAARLAHMGVDGIFSNFPELRTDAGR